MTPNGDWWIPILPLSARQPEITTVSYVKIMQFDPQNRPSFHFPPTRGPFGERSASQKRTLAFYSTPILAYFGNQDAYRAHLKKLCKSAAFFALFRLPGPLSRELLRRRNGCAGSYVFRARFDPSKNSPSFPSDMQGSVRVPTREKISRPIRPIQTLFFTT